jgi:hypothetical protein
VWKWIARKVGVNGPRILAVDIGDRDVDFDAQV